MNERASKVVEEDEPVVLPVANPPIVWMVCAATVAEKIAVLPENPTEIMPAPLMLSAVMTRVVADDDPVVLPSAVIFMDEADAAEVAVVAPEIIIVLPENPTLTPPAPLIVSALIARVVADDDPVVFPTAVMFIDEAAAAAVAEMTRAPAEYPTETMPAPEIVSRVSRRVCELVAPVVLPVAKAFAKLALAPPDVVAEIVNELEREETLTIPPPIMVGAPPVPPVAMRVLALRESPAPI